MKISIITVTYNSSESITECIRSVNKQTYPNVEHIFVDGKSIDNTVDIIRREANRDINILSEKDSGIYDAMNKGIRLATGDIIGMLNSDDQFYSSQSLEHVAEAFNNYSVDSIFGNMIYTNDSGEVVRKWVSKPFESGLFEKSWTPGHPTFYCKKSIYEKYGLYKTDYKIAADVELMLRYLEIHNIKSHFVDKILVNMKAGGVSNQGLSSIITITKEMKRAFRENNLRFNLFKYLFYKSLKVKEYLGKKI